MKFFVRKYVMALVALLFAAYSEAYLASFVNLTPDKLGMTAEVSGGHSFFSTGDIKPGQRGTVDTRGWCITRLHFGAASGINRGRELYMPNPTKLPCGNLPTVYVYRDRQTSELSATTESPNAPKTRPEAPKARPVITQPIPKPPLRAAPEDDDRPYDPRDYGFDPFYSGM